MNKNNRLVNMEQNVEINNIKNIIIIPQNNDYFNIPIEIEVENNVTETIQTIINSGGIWTTHPETNAWFFLPWPFAIILAE